MACGAVYEVNDGPWPVGETERPEYETSGAFGALLGNTDGEAVIKCNEICNRAGLDTISAGATLAWAIECYENEVLNREETGGLELNWGNAQAIVEATQALADGTGFGAVLAYGSQAATKRLGKGQEYLQTARGIELPMHDPRLMPGLARTYQYDPTPGRHVKGTTGWEQMGLGPEKYQTEGTGPGDAEATAFIEVLNSGGFCLFITSAAAGDQVFPLIEAVTGFGQASLQSTGLRILTMRHLFNWREGLTRADFDISPRTVGKPPRRWAPGRRHGRSRSAGRQLFPRAGLGPGHRQARREALQQLGGMDDVIQELYSVRERAGDAGPCPLLLLSRQPDRRAAGRAELA